MAALIGVSIKPTAGGDYTCNVPLDLLSEDGVPPAKGDQVSYSVDGTVQNVGGENATIKIDAINGQPVGAEGPEGSPQEEAQESPAEEAAEPDSTAAMGANLRKKAKANTLPLF